MMRYIVVIWFCLLSMLYSCVLYAEDANAQQYQDSILKIAHAMPNTLVRLTYLRDMLTGINIPLITKLSLPLCTRKPVPRRM